MEEAIYQRQVQKESLAGHLIDEQLFERCISKEDMMLYDLKSLNEEPEDKPKMNFIPDEDKLLAAVLNDESNNIWSVHKHDDLLQHQVGEILSEEETRQAWMIFQQEEALNANLKRLLPKKEQKKIVQNLFAKPSKNQISTNLSIRKLSDYERDHHADEETTRTGCTDDGTFWQKDKTWNGTITWDEMVETKCQASICKNIKETSSEGEVIGWKKNLRVKYLDKALLKKLPRNTSFKFHVVDILSADAVKMSFIEKKMEETVAVEVGDSFCLFITTKQDGNGTLFIGMTSEDSDFCKLISRTIVDIDRQDLGEGTPRRTSKYS